MRVKTKLLYLMLLGVASVPLVSQDWPMWGGTAQRNMISAIKPLPESWDVQGGKNIKWKVSIGTTAYGNPVVADGKIFLGTNNGNPRNPEIEGDKGVLMCFRESDGKFLWQAVTDKLESGYQNDFSEEGVCSSPIVEGKRLYYVSNRGELVCLDTEGGNCRGIPGLNHDNRWVRGGKRSHLVQRCERAVVICLDVIQDTDRSSSSTDGT